MHEFSKKQLIVKLSKDVLYSNAVADQLLARPDPIPKHPLISKAHSTQAIPIAAHPQTHLDLASASVEELLMISVERQIQHSRHTDRGSMYRIGNDFLRNNWASQTRRRA